MKSDSDECSVAAQDYAAHEQFTTNLVGSVIAGDTFETFGSALLKGIACVYERSSAELWLFCVFFLAKPAFGSSMVHTSVVTELLPGLLTSFPLDLNSHVSFLSPRYGS